MQKNETFDDMLALWITYSDQVSPLAMARYSGSTM